MTILEKIVAEKRREIERLPPRAVSAGDVKSVIEARPDRRDFTAALRRPRHGRIALIAEVKKASPSAGVIRADFNPVAIAKDYEAAGASCLSVLTDEKFFQGSLEYLKQIRQAVKLPLLRKDFVIDERQILEAAQWGGDAILLIVAILTHVQLKQFHTLAAAAGMAALVEVHDETELERALDAGAHLIGINNRDLRTFKVDLATTERLAAKLRSFIPKAADSRHAAPLLVAESGIHSRADVDRLARCGAQAILVGESLMRGPDIAASVRALIGGYRVSKRGTRQKNAAKK